MEGLCRAIAWYAIVAGGNKQRRKLSGDNHVKPIYLGSIVRGQFSAGNYLGIIISSKLQGNYPGYNYSVSFVKQFVLLMQNMFLYNAKLLYKKITTATTKLKTECEHKRCLEQRAKRNSYCETPCFSLPFRKKFWLNMVFMVTETILQTDFMETSCFGKLTLHKLNAIVITYNS